MLPKGIGGVVRPQDPGIAQIIATIFDATVTDPENSCSLSDTGAEVDGASASELPPARKTASS
jgi:hypothetical protein